MDSPLRSGVSCYTFTLELIAKKENPFGFSFFCNSERGIRTPLGSKKPRKFNVFQRACLQKSRKVTDLCSTYSKQNNPAIYVLSKISACILCKPSCETGIPDFLKSKRKSGIPTSHHFQLYATPLI